MYRMIVVDDEAAITDWLVQTLTEHFGGMLEVYKAYSADECMELMAKGSFHILMTDISMPLISGLDLLKAVSVFYPKTKKLVLSAHDNFEYAKKAIDFEIAAYVLKSEGDIALFTAVEKAIEEVERDKEHFKQEERLKQPHQQEFVKSSHIQRLLLGEVSGNFLDVALSYGLDFSLPVEMALLAIELRDPSQRAFLIMALEDSLAEYLTPHYTYALVETGIAEVTLLAQLNVRNDEGAAINDYINSPYVMYENAQESFAHLTRQYINIIYSVEQVNAVYLHKKLLQFRQIMQNCCNFDCSIILPEDTSFDGADSYNSPGGISREIGIVLKYISQNADQDLSLIMLAGVVYLNPSYLSHLFKQQVGVNLSEHIKIERIRICKEMLANPKYKIHEIAYNVGYDNPSYFSRFFKKFTGVTPQEYRNLL